jgi:PAS domain-containing protein
LVSTNVEIKKLSKEIQFAREYADNIIDTVRESLIILDKDLRVVSANRSFYRMFNTVIDKTVGRSIFELDDNKWEIPRLRELLEQIIPKENLFEAFEIEYDFADKGRRRLVLNARRMSYGEKETELILLSIEAENLR